MHIPDGFLSPEVAAGTAVVAAGAVGVGLRRAGTRLDDRLVPLLGVTGAFVFAAQMLNLPVAGGTSGHFLGAALATVLLGPWLATLVLAVVLATQSFVFADGGVSALGANIVDMGVLGALVVGGLMLAARRLLPQRRAVLLCIAGAGAWLAVVAGAAGTAACLALSGTVPLGTVLPAMLAVHVVIGVGEAVVTVAALSALMATRPDLIGGWAAAEPARARSLPLPQGA
jgi:cobalt/nickel transport system permease protein